MNVINQHISETFALYNGDCVEVIKGIPDGSVDFSVYSPPFSNLYIYSDSVADMGNSASDDEFMEHYLFLIHEKYRVTRAGRLTAVHCKDLPMYHNRDGAAGLKDFPGMIIRAHENAGWVYHSRVTIWKDPVIEMQRTKNHGLLHKNFTSRAEVCRQGMADYLIVFRKWDGVNGTESPVPVKQNRKAGDYVGERPPEYFEDQRDYSIQVWQRYASPVWFDINQTRVLNYQMAKEDQDEKHICPLQLDVIERAIDLWTNPGEVVLSPFAGIGSEGYCAIKRGRKFIGIELKESYFDWASKNLKQAEDESRQVDLFTFAGLNGRHGG
jgi:DNA modification methylase